MKTTPLNASDAEMILIGLGLRQRARSIIPYLGPCLTELSKAMCR
ncbi:MULTISPECIES: hypothetical protein [Bradyrhizobium]|nr:MULTISPECIES: hypothetical protein [Bradyrhizobium]WOH52913.1 hypothetical protein RX328_12985 [Bradyrhizobium sp. sBnM-33]